MSIARLMQMARAGVKASGGITDPQAFTIAGASTTPSATKSGVVTGNSHTYGFDPSGIYFFWALYPTSSIRRNTASTPFDITTLSTTPDQQLTRIGSNQFGVELSRDGTKIFSYGYDAGNHVYSATLSTPWDLTTASAWVGSGATLVAITNNHIRFSFDGTKLITAGYSGSAGIREYALSTAWDVATASYVGGYATGLNTTSVFLSGDGTDLLYTDTTNNFKQLELPTPFSLTAASQTNTLASSFLRGGYVTPDASKMITYSQSTQLLYEYTLPS